MYVVRGVVSEVRASVIGKVDMKNIVPSVPPL